MIPRPRCLSFDHLLVAEGWWGPAWVQIDGDGRVAALGEGSPPEVADEIVHLPGYALPGLSNLHSHAFQRALAGLGEARAPNERDDFWRWRRAMYATALTLSPDDLEAVAAWLYLELLEGGYTRVGEFHYLHHAPDGRPYDDITEMGGRIVAAAEATGIGLTLLPVLYQRGGFGRPAAPEQRRFVFEDLDAFVTYLETMRSRLEGSPRSVLGVAPHSLRAVDPAALARLFEAWERGPVHIHVAEQEAEVEACVATLGARPVAWLLDALPVDERWCLVHATCTEPSEVEALACSGAVAGLCPSTEAALGDGLFAVEDLVAAKGRFGVGSDAELCTSAAGELRLLEWGARLRTRRRGVLAGADPAAGGEVGESLWRAACRGGARALGVTASAALQVGAPADLVVLDARHPRLAGHDRTTALSAFLLGGAEGALSEVVAGGRWVVHEGRHRARARLLPPFLAAMRRLRETR